jgi:diguanylate cyclase (GGDEF)-like protein
MLMFIYFNIQNARLSADYLTGISNRRDIDSYLALLIKDVSSGPSFSGIFMDIDDFKNINDRYGHIVGDEALRVTADLLKRSMRKDDFIARFGGDEFIIIAPRLEKEAELKITAQRIIMNFEEYNRIGTLPFDLTLSMGSAVYKKGSGLTPAQFIKKLDDLMYENKRILGKL